MGTLMFSLAYFEVSREAVFLTSLIFFLGGFRSAAIYSCRGDHIAVFSLVSKIWADVIHAVLCRAVHRGWVLGQ